MGGAEAVLAKAREDFKKGEYRWVAEVMNKVVFAEPGNIEARALAADAFEQLGYQSESATWRNAYLYGAQELRQGLIKLPPRPIANQDLLNACTTETLFDFIAIRLNSDSVNNRQFQIVWRLTDRDEVLTLNLENSTLTHLMDKVSKQADSKVSTSRETLVALTVNAMSVAEAIENNLIKIEGKRSHVEDLFAMLDEFSPMFDIVAPSILGESRV
jgi:alkyl sulfatase BDS1-like metallo-beta-lactamase superfamily hydrolase